MKIKIWSLSLAATMLLTTGCAGISIKKSGAETAENITITADIHAIESNGSTDIEFRQGSPSFKLYAPEDMIEYIDLTVENGTLIISNYYPGNRIGSIKSKLVITYPDIDKFISGGTANIEIKNLKTNDLTIVSNGVGDIECESIECQYLTATTSGTGDIDIKDLKCTALALMTQGTGDIKCSNLDVAGAIGATTEGTGDIELSGKCYDFHSNKMGTGDINSKNLIKN